MFYTGRQKIYTISKKKNKSMAYFFFLDVKLCSLSVNNNLGLVVISTFKNKTGELPYLLVYNFINLVFPSLIIIESLTAML